MKRFLLTIFAIFLATFSSLNAQIFEGFNGGVGVNPPGWNFGNGTKVEAYNNPSLACASDIGLLTSGIGGGTPSTFITPSQFYTSGENQITLSFDFFLLPSSGVCEGASSTADCNITMNVWIVSKTYDNITKNGPPANSNAHYVGYQVVNILGNNTINIDVTPFAATMYPEYRIYVNFAAPCNLGGKKIYLDNFNLNDFTVCSTCPPVANKDFFKFGFGGWTSGSLKANLFGGNTDWATPAVVTNYPNKSLSLEPAENNGTDSDPNNLSLSNMLYQLATPLTVSNHGCDPSLPLNTGTLVLNPNGTFEYTLGGACINSVYFDYTLKNVVSNLVTAPTRVVIEIVDPIVTPVKFKSFTADRKNSSTVTVRWVTASEQTNRGFNVQRSTGGEWKNVAFVFSAADGGNSSSNLSYEYKDANSEKGISQYRIQQVDVDGKASYSDIRAVHGEKAANKVMIYPNPSNDGKVNIVFESSNSIQDVLISDVHGRIVKQYSGVSGNILTIDKLNSGFYTIKITDRSKAASSVQKVVVK